MYNLDAQDCGDGAQVLHLKLVGELLLDEVDVIDVTNDQEIVDID
jgi:hypothetical protein